MSSFISKVELKYQLQQMGIRVEGNYVRKRDIADIVSATQVVKISDFNKLPKWLHQNDHIYIKDYYLTGGCWGMAIAIYSFLKKQGYSPKLRVFDQFSSIHAYVEVMGKGIDARGVFDMDSDNPGGSKWKEDQIYTLAALKELARDYGPPTVAKDIESATRILENVFKSKMKKSQT